MNEPTYSADPKKEVRITSMRHADCKTVLVSLFCPKCKLYPDMQSMEAETWEEVEPKKKKETVYSERTAVGPLLKGKTVLVRGIGNSMTPMLKSGEIVTCVPIGKDEELKKNDVVLVKVKSQIYMHKITAIRGDQFQISNNHGHVNGWVTRDKIYGRYQKA